MASSMYQRSSKLLKAPALVDLRFLMHDLYPDVLDMINNLI